MNPVIERTNSFISPAKYSVNSLIVRQGLPTIRSDQKKSNIKNRVTDTTERTLKDYELIKLKKTRGFYEGDDPKFVRLWSGWNIQNIDENIQKFDDSIKEIKLIDLMNSLIPCKCNYEKFFDFCWKFLILNKTYNILCFFILDWLINKTILDLEKQKAKEESQKNIERIIATLNNLKVIDQLCIVQISDLCGIRHEIQELSDAFKGSQKSENNKFAVQYHPHEDIWKRFSSTKDDKYLLHTSLNKLSQSHKCNLQEKFDYKKIRKNTDIFCEIGLLYKVQHDDDELVPFTCTKLYTDNYLTSSRPSM